MKRLLFIILVLCVIQNVCAEDKLVATISGNTLMLNLENETEFTAFQADIVLPSENMPDLIEKGSRIASDNFVMDYEMVSANTLRVILHNKENEAISNTGTLVTCHFAEPLVGDIVVNNIHATTVDELTDMVLADINCQSVAYTLGDVNGDGGISVTDAVAVVNFILGGNVAGLSREAADINNDGDITVTDAVGVVNLILNAGNSSAASKSFDNGAETDLLTIGDVIVEDNNVRLMVKSLEDDMTASQFDIVLPAGVVLDDIKVADRHHAVSYIENSGLIRVLCYSLGNDLFQSGNIAELCLKVVSNNVGSIDFSNIELTRPDLSNMCARSQCLNADGLTGINGNNHSSTKTNLIYDFTGREVKDVQRKGTYIINGNKVRK